MVEQQLKEYTGQVMDKITEVFNGEFKYALKKIQEEIDNRTINNFSH